MKEDDLARRIVQRLDQNLNELPAEIVARLADARIHALHARATPLSWWVRLAGLVDGHRLMVKVALPAMFLLVAAGAVFFLQNAGAPDAFDIETALMHDELPIHAYTDPGFDAWLRNTSQDE
jgi:hypothetical protein